MDIDLVNFLLMDMDGYEFYKPHLCQSLVTSKVKVRSKVKIVTFRLIGYRDGANNSCESKLCQKAFQTMKKVAYKYGP